MASSTVPFGRLLPPTDNPRRSMREERIEELASTIELHGVLQNLLVQIEGEDFRVTTGGRRYRALELLYSRGKIGTDYPVKIEILSDDAAVAEIQAIENAQREDLDPIDEAERFYKLLSAKKGKRSAADVAARVGKSTRFVEQRAALAMLSAKVKAAVRDEKIPLGAAQVLTLATKADQERLLPDIIRGCENGWYSEKQLRQNVKGGRPPKSAAIFDLDLYTGTFTRELFTEADAELFDDIEQFRALQKAAIEAMIEHYQEKGAAFVDIVTHFQEWDYTRAPKKQKKGVGVVIAYDENRYTVSIHEGLLRRKERTVSSSGLNGSRATKTKPEFTARATALMRAEQTLAFQAALLSQPAHALALSTMVLLTGMGEGVQLKLNPAWELVIKEQSAGHVGITKIEEKALRLVELVNAAGDAEPVFHLSEEGSAVKALFGLRWSDPLELYERLKLVPDADLQELSSLLLICAVGPSAIASTHAKVWRQAQDDIGINIRDHYTPDAALLSLHSSDQLRAIATETGLPISGKAKKSELVQALAQHLKSGTAATADAADPRGWLPRPMTAQPVVTEEVGDDLDADCGEGDVEGYQEAEDWQAAAE